VKENSDVEYEMLFKTTDTSKTRRCQAKF